jgi:hypothetical protein
VKSLSERILERIAIELHSLTTAATAAELSGALPAEIAEELTECLGLALRVRRKIAALGCEPAAFGPSPRVDDMPRPRHIRESDWELN